jgi:hypothetical protein
VFNGTVYIDIRECYKKRENGKAVEVPTKKGIALRADAWMMLL